MHPDCRHTVRRAALASLLVALSGFMLPGGVLADSNWPQFRGRSAAGVSDGPPTPTTWNVEKGENVRWKTSLPGLAHSSPVIWGDRLFVTTAVAGEDQTRLKTGLYGDIQPVNEDVEFRWLVLCLDRKTGKVLWEKEAAHGKPKVKRHPKSTHANSTPAVDGKRLVAFFGSEGLHAFDLDGKPLWSRDFGTLDSGYYVAPGAQWGFGSSPVIHEDKVIIQVDVQHDSFLAALDAATGKDLWRVPRTDVPTWSTPTIYHEKDRAQVIVNGLRQVGGYDLASGRELWKMAGGGDIPVPTPIFTDDLIFITNAHGMAAPILAIKTNAEGDISLGSSSQNEFVAWSKNRGGNYMQTPIAIGELVFFCLDNGVLTCYDAETGQQHFKERLSGKTGFTASPVSDGRHIYYTDEDGNVYVVKAASTFEKVAENALGDACMASPAVADGVLYFRTQHSLIAIGAAK